MKRRMWLGALGGLSLGTVALLGGLTLAAAQDGEDTSIEGLSIMDMAITPAIERSRPTERVTTLAQSAGRFYCWVRVQNDTGGEAQVRLSIEPASGEPQASPTAGHPLDVPSRRHRTFLRAGTGRGPGSHRCVARTMSGAVLRAVTFTITE